MTVCLHHCVTLPCGRQGCVILELIRQPDVKGREVLRVTSSPSLGELSAPDSVGSQSGITWDLD